MTKITVHSEPGNLHYFPPEKCVGCGSPTRHWMEDKHTQLCHGCCERRNVKADHGPTATFWALRERGKNVPADIGGWTVFPDQAVQAYKEMSHTHELVRITVEPMEVAEDGLPITLEGQRHVARNSDGLRHCCGETPTLVTDAATGGCSYECPACFATTIPCLSAIGNAGQMALEEWNKRGPHLKRIKAA